MRVSLRRAAYDAGWLPATDAVPRPPPAPRVGLVGYGSAGRGIHAPLLVRAGLTWPPSSTSNATRADEVRAGPPRCTRSCPTSRRSSRRRRLDLVVLASPSGVHADQAERVIEPGLPLVVDKPLALDASRALDVRRPGGAPGGAADGLQQPALRPRAGRPADRARRRARRRDLACRIPLGPLASRAQAALARAGARRGGWWPAPRPAHPPRRPGRAAARRGRVGLCRGRRAHDRRRGRHLPGVPAHLRRRQPRRGRARSTAHPGRAPASTGRPGLRHRRDSSTTSARSPSSRTTATPSAGSSAATSASPVPS